MSVSSQRAGMRVVASVVAAVALGSALAGSASAADSAAPPAMAPPAPAKAPAKVKVPRAHFSSIGRFSARKRRLHAGRLFNHSLLWCNSSQIGANDGASATTNAGTEWVQITNTLFRWNGSAWVKDVSGATAAAGGRAIVNFTNPWFYYPSGNSGAAIGTAFNIGLHGYYYAVAQDIRWYSVATGQFLDRDYAWVNNAYGDSYYCYV